MDQKKKFRLNPYSTLPAFDAGWLSLKDHFIATVGPHSGTGRPLKNLLVLADAKMQAYSSFQKHPHQDMEILTWVVEGTLHHQDNQGFDQKVPALNLQLMSAGDGLFHAEGNSSDKSLRILQIWIKPKNKGGKPEVTSAALEGNDIKLLAGPKEAPLIIDQDLWLYGANIKGTKTITVPENQFGYSVLIGKLKLDNVEISDGDGAFLEAGSHEVSGNGQIILMNQKHQET